MLAIGSSADRSKRLRASLEVGMLEGERARSAIAGFGREEHVCRESIPAPS